MSAPVHYTLVPVDPAAHLFRVTCTVARPDPAGQRFRLPAWIPGSYMIREFAKNIVELWATNADGIVACEKVDKSTWRCEPVDGPLTVTCEVYAWDLSVRAAHLDDSHAYFNGTSVFLAVVGQEHSPCRVTLLPPDGEAFRDWRVATALRAATGTAEWCFGDYEATDYDELIDHPVEMGRFSRVRFHACGVPHDLVITGQHGADLGRLCRDLTKICEAQIRFFGEPAPMDRYVFLVMAVGEGYGGLEHRASTSLLCSRDDLPQAGDDPVLPKESYRQFLGLCSHEYFHTWNVKRIKPAAFVPYNLAHENHTRQLWMFEGFTSYYDDLFLVRSGLITPASYLELLGQAITRHLRVPGRFRQSVAESSFDAWTKYYRQDENTPNAVVSYYVKGSLVALLLDLEIRRRTTGARSLDDVMQVLWQRHGRTGVGVEEDGVQQVAEEVVGGSLAEFFLAFVQGTEEPSFGDALADMGIAVNLRAAEGQGDTGGKPGKALRARPTLGIRTQADPLGARIQHCYEGGAAMLAGLSGGDVIVAIDGLRTTQAGIEKQLGQAREGETLRVHAFRRDELREFAVVPQAAPADTCWLDCSAGAMPAPARAWLGGEG